jgi:glycosyltransferase involved in cell wall biosynthesis
MSILCGVFRWDTSGGILIMTTVSVIVPSYNHGRFIRHRLDSILSQTYRDFEVILLDDASTDDTRTILKEYADHLQIKLLLRENNGGSVFKQWNTGVSLAQGRYAWIAESDDYADEKFLEEMVAVLDQHPAVGLVKCKSTVVDEDSRPILGSVEQPASRDWSHDFIIPGQEDCLLQLVHGNSITNASAVLFRRQLYLDVGWADESYRMCADWLQWAKMLLRADFAYLARPLNYYRWHGNTVRKRCQGNVIHDLEDLQVCRYLLSNLPAPEAVVQGVYNRIVMRWVNHSLSNSRIERSLGYDLRILRILREGDCRYARRIATCILRKVLRKCLSRSGRRGPAESK